MLRRGLQPEKLQNTWYHFVNSRVMMNQELELIKLLQKTRCFGTRDNSEFLFAEKRTHSFGHKELLSDLVFDVNM